MESDSLTRAWAAALDAVPTDELGPVATSMLRSARPLGDIEGTILLAVPNDFTKQWIEDKAQNKLTTALSVHLGRTVRIAITVDPSIEVVTEEEEKEEPAPVAPEPTPAAPALTPACSYNFGSASACGKPKYTQPVDNFRHPRSVDGSNPQRFAQLWILCVTRWVTLPH